MSISLTWANYALMVTVCLAIYYTAIGFLFYRSKIKMVSSDKKEDDARYNFANLNISSETENKNLFGEPASSYDKANAEESDFNAEAQDFADEIVAFTSSCNEVISKENLIESIKRIIRKYPSLHESESRYELNQLIAISTENYCSTHISAEELNELWRN